MYENETYETILDRLLSRFPATFDKRQGSVLWDVFSPVAIELSQAYTQMDNVLNLGFAESTTGEYLERRVAEQGMTRKPSVKASGFVTVSGAVGTVIPLGTLMSTDSDTPTYFVTTEEVTIVSESIEVPAEAEEGGTEGNVINGSITVVLGDLSGSLTVTNAEVFNGGIDEETDEELYARYYEKVSRPATSGNKFHYEQWAKEIPGIADARCYPIWQGVGTVKVVVIDSEKRSPSTSALNRVKEHIDTQRPVLADVTVVGVTEVSVDITASLTLRDGTDISAVRASINTLVTDYFKSIAFVGDTLRYTAIGNALLDSDGVIDYSDLKINGRAANIILSEEEVPVIGAITIN